MSPPVGARPPRRGVGPRIDGGARRAAFGKRLAAGTGLWQRPGAHAGTASESARTSAIALTMATSRPSNPAVRISKAGAALHAAGPPPLPSPTSWGRESPRNSEESPELAVA